MAVEAVVFGEALWDIFPDAERLGGAPLNFAVRLAELGHAPALVTRIGTDSRGDAALSMLAGTPVDISLVQRDADKPTGTVPVTLGPDGDAEYLIVHDVAYDRIEASPATLRAAAGAACLYYGTLAQRSEKSRESLLRLIRRMSGALRFCDINLRQDCFGRRAVNNSLSFATVLKLNEGEVGPVTDLAGGPDGALEFSAWLLERCSSLECVVVTLGERGAIAITRDETVYAPGRRVRVVDLVGAGDAFAAAFVHGTLNGWPIARRLEFANAVGAMVAGQAGATTPLDLDQLDAIVGDAGKRVVDPRFA